MNKIADYERDLINISPKKWEAFLKEHSGLPGPRANIELARAFARTATLMDFKKYIRLDWREAPENSPEVFLVFCGALGLGEYLSEYHDGGLQKKLRKLAHDPRWRVREAVAMALQIVGDKDIHGLLKYLKSWMEGSYLEQRAAVVAISEPRLLNTPLVTGEALDILDWVTATMIEKSDQITEEYEILQKALSYCWSVVVAENPARGRLKMERWIKQNHPVTNRIMVENLRKKRLQKMDEEWVKSWLERLSG